jgi:hypothetical protein
VIRVEPATLAWLEALADGDDVFTARFDLPVVAGWAPFRDDGLMWRWELPLATSD